MKTNITIFLIIISFISYGQNNNYNDWFDLNLKGKPKSIKEISIFSLEDLYKPEFKAFIDKPIDSLAFIDEYHFDSLGIIIKEFHKNTLDPQGQWFDYKTQKKQFYKDSIVSVEIFPNGQIKWKETKHLDSLGYILKKTVVFPIKDTLKFIRDTKHKIIKSYNHSIGIDSGSIVETENELNTNGDITLEKKTIKILEAINESPNISSTIKRYEYIYDSTGNWILKVTFENESITVITQRNIEYN